MMFEQFKDQEIVWITMINLAYTDFTKNFLESMKRSNCTFTFIVYCIDDEIMEVLKSYTNCVCISLKCFLKTAPVSGAVQYGQKDWPVLQYCKLDAMLHARQCLREYNVKYVGYLDTDVVLFTDPTVVALNYIREHPSCDFIMQCDEQKQECSNKTKCPRFCAGVMIMQTREEIDYVFKYTEDDFLRNPNDQAFLNNNFKKSKTIQYCTIDKEIFMNGAYKFAWNLPVSPNSCLLHFNYIQGNDRKKNKMKKMNMWYLPT